MSAQDIFDFAFMFVVGAVFSLTWWRLVWAIRRGDEWEMTAEYNRLHRQALALGRADLMRELQRVRQERDSLLDDANRLDERADYEGAIEGWDF